jgi:hypothetical protein
MKRVPEAKIGTQTIRTTTRLIETECVRLKFMIKTRILHAIPVNVRIIPPANSHFQAMIRIIMRIYAGIRFIRNEPILCQKV